MMIAMGLVQSQSNAIRDDSEMVNAIEEISFGEVWSGLARMRRHQGGAFGAAVRSRVGLCLARERRVKAAFGVARDQQLPSPDPQPAPKDPAPPRNPGKPLAFSLNSSSGQSLSPDPPGRGAKRGFRSSQDTAATLVSMLSAAAHDQRAGI